MDCTILVIWTLVPTVIVISVTTIKHCHFETNDPLFAEFPYKQNQNLLSDARLLFFKVPEMNRAKDAHADRDFWLNCVV